MVTALTFTPSFPEFPPDGNPMNDPFGSDGWVGSGDLKVDYQDTSADFWRLMDTYQPHIVVTTSRGGSIGWEVEAVEGGHDGGSGNPADDWNSDQHGSIGQPTQASVDARSWTGHLNLPRRNPPYEPAANGGNCHCYPGAWPRERPD